MRFVSRDTISLLLARNYSEKYLRRSGNRREGGGVGWKCRVKRATESRVFVCAFVRVAYGYVCTPPKPSKSRNDSYCRYYFCRNVVVETYPPQQYHDDGSIATLVGFLSFVQRNYYCRSTVRARSAPKIDQRRGTGSGPVLGSVSRPPPRHGRRTGSGEPVTGLAPGARPAGAVYTDKVGLGYVMSRS